MPKINKHIEIVRSSKASLSSMGQQYCSMVMSVLSQRYARVGVTVVNNTDDLDAIAELSPDVVFLGVKQVPVTGCPEAVSQMVWVADYLDEVGITYTGSTASAVSLDYDKSAAKRVVSEAGLLTADSFSALPNQFLEEMNMPLPFPLFVKPPSGGGGQGIGPQSVVRNMEQFAVAVDAVKHEYDKESLVESYLIGREFSVAVLRDSETSNLTALSVELVADMNSSGDRILGSAVKKSDNEQVLAVGPGLMRDEVESLALQVFQALGARDYGRIDLRLDAAGKAHFIEANLLPGLHSRTSYFTRAYSMSTGLTYESMILQIIGLAVKRSSQTSLLIEGLTDDYEQPHRDRLSLLPVA